MKKNKRIRRRGFGALKAIMKRFIKPSSFIYLGGELPKGTVIVSNHVGTAAPLALELYSGLTFRFWGAWQMNAGLIRLYRYQSRVFYHEKKHWNLHLARLFCLLASPLTYLFYNGLNLISTYPDARFRKTVSESLEALRLGQHLVVFPEDSTNGYLDQLEGFHGGFLMLGKIARRHGLDFPISIAYYKKSERTYVFDAPILVSELLDSGEHRADIAQRLCERCNYIGRTSVEQLLAEASTAEVAASEADVSVAL